MIDINNKSFNFYDSDNMIESQINILRLNNSFDIFTDSIYTISEKYIPIRKRKVFFNQFNNRVSSFNNEKSEIINKKYETFTGIEILFSENSLIEANDYKDFCLLDSNFLLLDLNHNKSIIKKLEKNLSQIIENKIIPIIAHPERLEEVDINKLKKLKKLGVLFQLSIGSLQKNFGEKVEENSINLLKYGIFDFIASDTNNYEMFNDIFLEKSLDKASKIIGYSSMTELIYKNPSNILDHKTSNNYQI
tara:strand:- start:12260 stop:13003 length:744 start_codon:yes stop_codon:yes gene_type:complete